MQLRACVQYRPHLIDGCLAGTGRVAAAERAQVGKMSFLDQARH